MKHSSSQGFTLIEVLVALAIVSIALLAGMQATTALTRNAMRQSDIFLAQLCAENELIKLRLSKQMPPVGESTQLCDQAAQHFSVALSGQPTPNPNFVRVVAQVFQGNTPLIQLSTVMGRY
jgi:general secretion pathway protein I